MCLWVVYDARGMWGCVVYSVCVYLVCVCVCLGYGMGFVCGVWYNMHRCIVCVGCVYVMSVVDVVVSVCVIG